MSNTPITDKACGWPVGHHGHIDSSDLKLSPDGPFVHSSVARELERENAALRGRCEELEAERTQFANRAARLAAVEHELEESRKAERLARAQLQSEREARK